MSNLSVESALDLAKGLSTDSARLDIEVLLCHVLKKTRTWLYTWPDSKLTAEQVVAFRLLVSQRAEGQPIAYLTGEREFWSLPIKVNDSTLIPRPDTELLVDLALALLPKQPMQ